MNLLNTETEGTSTNPAPENAGPSVPWLGKKKIVWKVPQLNYATASFRYRCLIPLKYLARLGFTSEVYSDSDPVNLAKNVAVVIFVKSFSRHDLEYAERAKALGIPIILDLCDNIFFQASASQHDFSEILISEIKIRNSNFRRMAKDAKAIVCPTPDLAKAIGDELGFGKRIKVIPDAAETEDDLAFAKRFRLEERLRQLKSNGWIWLAKSYLSRAAEFAIGHTRLSINRLFSFRISQRPALEAPIEIPSKRLDLPQILWFGNAGNSLFGISDLELVRQPLTEVYKEIPFQLSVVSSSREAFAKHVSTFPFPTRYVDWSPERLNLEFAQATLVIIPNQLNPFSRCKSSNRALLALKNHVPVVATRSRALEPLKSSIVVDDWIGGIKSYLLDPTKRENDVKLANKIIAAEYSGEQIAEHWARTLGEI